MFNLYKMCQAIEFEICAKPWKNKLIIFLCILYVILVCLVELESEKQR